MTRGIVLIAFVGAVACPLAALPLGAAPPPPPAAAPSPPLPQDPNEAAARAAALLKDDLFEDAMDAAAAAAERWPDHAGLQAALGDALYRRGDFEEAERHYRRGVAIDPNDPAAHFGVGRILRTAGRYGDAAESFSRAATLAPSVPKYLRVLANHLARREDAIGMLKRYLELASPDPERAGEEPSMVRNVQAWVALLEKMGDRPLSEFVKKEPGEVKLQVFKGQAYFKISVAGLKNQRFVFDTGATGITISPRVASRAKISPIKPFTISGTGARRTETGDLVVIDEIAVGDGIVVRNVPATVRDPAGPEEGLVGPSLFSIFDITVDLKAGRLLLEAAGSRHEGKSEPFRNVGGEIMITSRVNGLPFNALLDTGASSTLIGRTTVGRVPGLLTVPERWDRAVPGGATVGVGGRLADRKVVLEGSLSFAGRDYTAGGLLSGDLSGFSRSLESEVYVILGSQHLADTPFTIDYRGMTVTFAAPGAKAPGASSSAPRSPGG